MFDNEKIYVKEIKTVTSSEKRIGKKVYEPSSQFFGISASVYGKLINCFFGGSYPEQCYAISQACKGTVISDCLYDVRCQSLKINGTDEAEFDNPDTVIKLNNSRKNANEYLKDVKLNEWTMEDGHPALVKNITEDKDIKSCGSRENPYIIKTAEDFIKFTNNLNRAITYRDKYFLQVSDIDLSSRTDYVGANGSGKPFVFEGFYDGGGHTVKIALDITDRKCNNTIFPYVDGVVVNLGIIGTIASDGRYISGFARSVRFNGCIANCYSLVKITTRSTLDISYELRYSFSGESEILCDGQTYKINAGSVLYIPKRTGITAYMEEISSPSDSISIYFDTDFSLPDKIFVCDMSENKDIEQLFERMYVTWLGRKGKYYLECMSMIYEIISKLSKPTGNYIPKDKYLMIEKGVEYLYNNCFNKDIDFYLPAKLCGISYTYFKQLFVQKFEKAPKQYVTALRMERALELLSTGKYSVTEVTEHCGFESVYYFSRAFKRYYGSSPKNYID